MIQREADNNFSEKTVSPPGATAKEIDDFIIKRTDCEVLGIQPLATRKEIKTAHRTLVRKFHPDFNRHLTQELRKKTEEITQRINNAKDALLQLAPATSSAGTTGTNDSSENVPPVANDYDYDYDYLAPPVEEGPSNWWYNLKSYFKGMVEMDLDRKKLFAYELMLEIEREKKSSVTVKALKKFQQMRYVFRFPQLEDTIENYMASLKDVTPAELSNQIIQVLNSLDIEPKALEEMINSLPRRMGIRENIRNEVSTIQQALKTLKIPEDQGIQDTINIYNALKQLQDYGVVIDIPTVEGISNINPITQLSLITRISKSSDDVTIINELIVYITPVNDLDLRIYFNIREGSFYKFRWKDISVPGQIAVRYAEYEKKRKN